MIVCVTVCFCEIQCNIQIFDSTMHFSRKMTFQVQVVLALGLISNPQCNILFYFSIIVRLQNCGTMQTARNGLYSFGALFDIRISDVCESISERNLDVDIDQLFKKMLTILLIAVMSERHLWCSQC